MNDSDFASVPADALMSPCPMTFGQILDRIFRLTRAHLKLFLSVALIPSAALLLMIGLLELAIWIPIIRHLPNAPSPEIMRDAFAPQFIIPVIAFFFVLNAAIFSVYLAAGSYAAIEANAGHRVTFLEAYGHTWQHAGRHFWLMVLMYLYAALPALVLELVVMLGAGLLAQGSLKASPELVVLIPFAVLFYIAAMVYAIWMGLRLSLAFPACVAENLAARPAITRSFQLTRDGKGRIFLVMLVIYAALCAGMMVFELVVMLLVGIGIFAAIALNVHIAAPWSYIGAGLFGIFAIAFFLLFTALTWSVMTTALAVLYHDQRLRIDGWPAAPQQTPVPV